MATGSSIDIDYDPRCMDLVSAPGYLLLACKLGPTFRDRSSVIVCTRLVRLALNEARRIKEGGLAILALPCNSFSIMCLI